MKDHHVGSKGDKDETGMKGWICKFVCVGCGKNYSIEHSKKVFIPENYKRGNNE